MTQQTPGDRYDAAVRVVWADIDPQLTTRDAWAKARPGMVAAQQRLDADLAERRAEQEPEAGR